MKIFLLQIRHLKIIFAKNFASSDFMRIFAFDLKRQRNGLVITGLMTQETQKSMLSGRTADFKNPLNTSHESKTE